MFKSYSVKQAPEDTYKQKHISLTSDRKMLLSTTHPHIKKFEQKESKFATVST
tara:strand:- start:35 stop:193 length:159 start_codon:yes stop_codon:yes gene_type:complete